MESILPYAYPLGVGLLAGWIANLVLGGKGGLVRNLILGLLGGAIGGIIGPKLGLTLTDNVHLNNVIMATGGAVLLLFIVQFLGK